VVVGAKPDPDSQNSRHGFSLVEVRLNSKGSSETPSNLKRGRIRYLGRVLASGSWGSFLPRIGCLLNQGAGEKEL
jgi:hypothetical protein